MKQLFSKKSMSELEPIIKKFRLRFSVFQRQHFVCPRWTTIFEHSGLFGKDVEADWRIFVTEGQYWSDIALNKLLITYILPAMQYDKKAFFPLQTFLASHSGLCPPKLWAKANISLLHCFFSIIWSCQEEKTLIYIIYIIS